MDELVHLIELENASGTPEAACREEEEATRTVVDPR
jgi:hypothetical protein